jgi:hypothetical protein
MIQCNGPDCGTFATVSDALGHWSQRTSAVDGSSIRSQLDFCSFPCELGWSLQEAQRRGHPAADQRAFLERLNLSEPPREFPYVLDPGDWWPIRHQGCSRPGAFLTRMPAHGQQQTPEDFAHIDGAPFTWDDLQNGPLCGTCGVAWETVAFLARAQLALEEWQRVRLLESHQSDQAPEEVPSVT